MPILALPAHRAVLKYCFPDFPISFRTRVYAYLLARKNPHLPAYRISEEGPGKSLDLSPTVLDTRSRLLLCQAPSGGL